MKLCNLLYTLLLLVVFTGNTTVQAQANKVIHQLITVDATAKQVNLKFDSDNVIVHRSPSSRIQLEMMVTIGSPSSRMLDFLVNKGRYDILTSFDSENTTFHIGHKQENAKMIVQGSECSETLSYIVYIPESIRFVTINDVDIEKIAKPGEVAAMK